MLHLAPEPLSENLIAREWPRTGSSQKTQQQPVLLGVLLLPGRAPQSHVL
jgi:hypothetical protein